ncbi:MgtC/SapB transporter [sediment metagenome]|uniref:MgtC/SapB transporter n=1 Tax=sediment metagenome TaxID=749907 RepID=D9PHB5_9ZZZZ
MIDELNFFVYFSNPIFQLIISVLLGAFVGLRREFDLQKGNTDFRGLRTTVLVSVFGTLSTIFGDSVLFPLSFFVVLGVFVAIAYFSGVSHNKIGLTSEISLILMFWSGVLIGYEEFTLGIILAFIVAISDAYKDKMHNFANNINLKE